MGLRVETVRFLYVLAIYNDVQPSEHTGEFAPGGEAGYHPSLQVVVPSPFAQVGHHLEHSPAEGSQ